MALLSVLSGLRHQLAISLQAVHFNHRLRPEALRDARFVEAWCGKLQVPLIVGSRVGAPLKHLSEEEARQIRFEFFIKTARSLRAPAIALAHTRNDLAETVLMRMMRGSGLYGLKAIVPRRSIEGIDFVRPLLGEGRQDIENYLKLKKISFRTDSTNRRTVYERNKIRHRLLPLLAREYNPQITDVLSDLAGVAGEDYEYLSTLAQRLFDKQAVISRRKVRMPLKVLGRQHPSMTRLIFRQMAEVLVKDPSALSFGHIHALEHLVSADGKGEVHLPHQLKAVRRAGFLEMASISKTNL